MARALDRSNPSLFCGSGRCDREETVMSELETAQQEEPKDKRAPIVIGIFAALIFALATAINYGGLFHTDHAASEPVAPASATK